MVAGDHSLGTRGQRAGDREGEGGGGEGKDGIKVGVGVKRSIGGGDGRSWESVCG